MNTDEKVLKRDHVSEQRTHRHRRADILHTEVLQESQLLALDACWEVHCMVRGKGAEGQSACANNKDAARMHSGRFASGSPVEQLRPLGRPATAIRASAIRDLLVCPRNA
jgi:hypothetical protein